MNKISTLLLLLVTSTCVSAQISNYNPIVPDNLANPTIVQIGKTRFLRVRILEGTPAIWEVKIYE